MHNLLFSESKPISDEKEQFYKYQKYFRKMKRLEEAFNSQLKSVINNIEIFKDFSLL